MYQALYRKWRPKTFDDVVGQANITDTLKRQITGDRLSHAYLFTGTRGTGKTSCAKILARAVNCESPVDGNPCNQCPSCLGIENGSILDVLELDAASNNGVDHVRALRDEAIYSPAAVRKRVYIVDEVHMLSTPAFNALLKILEEPPPHLMFILATTELHKVPATIKSRCQQFAFQRISQVDIAQHLTHVAQAEGVTLTEEGAHLLARLADGGLRDALSLFDQCAVAGVAVDEACVLKHLGLAGSLETAQLMNRIVTHDTEGALMDMDRLYQGGRDVAAILGELASLTRDLLIRKTAPRSGSALLGGGFDEATLRGLSATVTVPQLTWMLTRLQEGLSNLPRSTNRRTEGELCLIRLCEMQLDDSLAGLLARLNLVETQLSAGVPVFVQRKPIDTSVEQVKPLVTKPAELEETPPWVVDEPVVARPVETPPVKAPQPVAPQPIQPVVQPVAPAPTQGVSLDSQKLWPALVAGLKAVLPRTVYSFMSNPTMVQGTVEDGILTLWATDDLVKGMVSKPKVLTEVETLASNRLGSPIRARVEVGKAPAVAPVAVESGEPRDKLDDLMAFSSQFD